MRHWLVKEEPSNYSFGQFVKDGSTTWTGVKNPVAQKHLRGIGKGDRVFYYHTGEVKAVVGVAEAAGDAYVDPDDATGKSYTVDLVPLEVLPRPVTLKEIKGDPFFAGFDLVRVPRLSVMPVTPEQWARILEMSGKTSG